MAYRPLIEWDETKKSGGELWRTLTKKINDALDYLYNLVTSIAGVKNSIEKDTDNNIQLVNDLTDAELEAQGTDLVYGYSKDSKARGWMPYQTTGGGGVSGTVLFSQTFSIYDWSGNELIITHNLSTTNIIVSVWNNSGKSVITDIEIVNENVVKLSGEAFEGKIIILYQGLYCSEFSDTDWVDGELTITHNLGTENVIVQVWNGSNIAIVDVSIIDENTIKLQATENFTGKVLIIGG